MIYTHRDSKSMILRSFGTHDGSFHADEVTACALLLLFKLIDQDKVVRTRDESKLAGCAYVCDVGGVYDPSRSRFDHHQLSYKGDLSSAGMVLLFLKESQVIDSATYDYLNRSLIAGVDAHDTGRSLIPVGVCSFSHIISNFVPPAYDASEEELKAAFFQAVDFTLGHLTRLLTRYQYIFLCKELVEEQMQKKLSYLLFEKAIPWLESFFDLGGEKHPALFVVMPSGHSWKLRAIPPTSEDRMKMRVALPEEWAGLRDQELESISGIKGAIFCHKGRFISIWKTREAALEALQKALKGSR